MERRLRLLALGALLLLLLLPVSAVLSGDDHQIVAASPDRQIVTRVDYLGRALFPTAYLFQDTEVGGLSGITFDAGEDVYYLLSDDRGDRDPARFYTASINLSDGRLDNGDVVFTGMTALRDNSGDPFVPGTIDPEGIAITNNNRLIISSEGALAADPVVPPFISEFNLNGQRLRDYNLPDKFVPSVDGTQGVRSNLAFEGVTIRPDEQEVYAIVENALAQDGPAAGLNQKTLSRLVAFDRSTAQPKQEVVYAADAVAEAPAPEGGETSAGVADILALDNNGSFLMLERSYSEGKGFTVRLYLARAQGALDVSDVAALKPAGAKNPYEVQPSVQKELLLDFDSLGLPFVDNIEGMTFGPTLEDGRRTLILVSDNNFLPPLPSQVIALAVELAVVPSAAPVAETERMLAQAPAAVQDIAGEANAPAVWVHPTDPSKSLLIQAVGEGGLLVSDLSGALLQTLAPPAYGDVRYTSVAVLYGVPMPDGKTDLAIVADRKNDTLVVFTIDPGARRLTAATSPLMPASIFGFDDGRRTAHGLAAYTSLRTGTPYVFVTQGEGSGIAQIQIDDDGGGRIRGEVVRQLELPAGRAGAEPIEAGGSVADARRGQYYVALNGQGTVVRFNAEPDAGSGYEVIDSIKDAGLSGQLDGLAIYQGGPGYLLVADTADQSFAVFEAGGNNSFIGRFIVGHSSAGPSGDIDQTNAPAGLDVVNVPLGLSFPYGVVVVRDSANDPQNAVAQGTKLLNSSTNFKLVPWHNVANAFEQPLRIDPVGFNPRYPVRLLLPAVVRP